MFSSKSSIGLRLIVLAILLAPYQLAESQNFEVSATGFSLNQYDDYSPVYFRDGLVFCSTRKPDVQPEQDANNQMEDADIWYVLLGKVTSNEAHPIRWEELCTGFNDGPVTCC